MSRAVVFSLFCSMSYCLITLSAIARPVEDWPYQRLSKEADLIVIGSVTEVKDASDTFIDKRWPLEFVGINTTFEVKNVFKGDIGEKRIVVLHYKFGKVHTKANVQKGQIVEVIDGPRFVSFISTPSRIEIDGVQLANHKLEYLLFLKKRKDGRYELVSGAIDPNMSVRELIVPICSSSDGIKKEK